MFLILLALLIIGFVALALPAQVPQSVIGAGLDQTRRHESANRRKQLSVTPAASSRDTANPR
jgi:hypothetical protein